MASKHTCTVCIGEGGMREREREFSVELNIRKHSVLNTSSFFPLLLNPALLASSLYSSLLVQPCASVPLFPLTLAFLCFTLTASLLSLRPSILGTLYHSHILYIYSASPGS